MTSMNGQDAMTAPSGVGRRGAVASVIGLVALALAACGGGGDGPTPPHVPVIIERMAVQAPSSEIAVGDTMPLTATFTRLVGGSRG